MGTLSNICKYKSRITLALVDTLYFYMLQQLYLERELQWKANHRRSQTSKYKHSE